MMEYIDGILDLEAERELMSHIEGCKACKNEFSILQETLELVEDIEEVEPPVELVDLVMTNIDPKKYRRRIGMKVPLLGTALVVICLSTLYFVLLKGVIGLLSDSIIIKDMLVSAFVNLVNFLVLTLPNALSFIRGIFPFSLSFSIYAAGVTLALLLILSIIEIYLLGVLKSQIRRN